MDNKFDRQFILITSSNFPTGGAGANYLYLFCKGLKINGFSIKVWLLRGFSFGNYTRNHKKRNITTEGIPFTYLCFSKRSAKWFVKIVDDFFSFFYLLFYIFSIIPTRKSTILLLYSTELYPNILIFFFSKLAGVKVVTFVPEYYEKYVFHGSMFRRIKWYSFLFNFYFLNKLSYKLIVFSFYLKDQYLKLGFSEKNIIIQPNLTDFEFWNVKAAPIKYTLGYSGSPSRKDGVYDLLNAVSILKKDRTDISLIVIGDSQSGPSLLPDLKLKCKQLNILENVFFSGLVEIDEVKKLLSGCEILVLTRQSTVQTQAGFPTKLGEYFASRKKIIVTNFGDIGQYFAAGKNLVIAESGNVEDIAKKIKWVIENEAASDEIAINGYQTAMQLLEYKNSVKKILDFLR